MNVLITGAAGFIGSHLVDAYLQRGDSVYGIDNLLSGDAQNLRDAQRSEQFTFLHADVSRDHPAIELWLAQQSSRIDAVLHFASPASPKAYSAFPLETLAVNSAGTEFCCRIALQHEARFLYASTSEIYGDPLEHPQSERYFGNVNPVGPRSCYDEAKRFGEATVAAYVRAKQLDARIVRIFNTYGPRMRADDGRVVPSFLAAALNGEPFAIFGDGSHTRSFCYVGDLVVAIVRAAERDGLRGCVINLGSPHEVSIAGFAAAVARVAGIELRTVSLAAVPEEPARRRPDIETARKLLGWEPNVKLDEGLTLTLRALRSGTVTHG